MRRIATYLGRRILGAIFTVLVLILVTFVIYWVIPVSPVRFVYSSQQLSQYQIDHANHLLGLDRSKAAQYFHYVWQVLHGNFGRQWTGSELIANTHLQQAPINPFIFAELRVTLSIILGGALLVVLIALPLGTFTGRRVGSFGDRAVSWASLVGICTHPLVLGSLLATYIGFEHLNWLPSGGYCTLGGPPHAAGSTNFFVPGQPSAVACHGLGPWAEHLILPWITFALLFIALYTRMIRASVADTLHEDFVRTARAKGASEFRVLQHHVVPSAGLRVLTMVGMEIGTAVTVCIYIESAFGMFGLGRQAVQSMGGAISQIDLPQTLAVVTLISLVVVIGNLIVDLLYVVLDPRAGRETGRSKTKALVGGVF